MVRNQRMLPVSLFTASSSRLTNGSPVRTMACSSSKKFCAISSGKKSKSSLPIRFSGVVPMPLATALFAIKNLLLRSLTKILSGTASTKVRIRLRSCSRVALIALNSAVRSATRFSNSMFRSRALNSACLIWVISRVIPIIPITLPSSSRSGTFVVECQRDSPVLKFSSSSSRPTSGCPERITS